MNVVKAEHFHTYHPNGSRIDHTVHDQRVSSELENDQAHHEPSPKFGLPDTPMHINGSIMFPIIKL